MEDSRTPADAPLEYGRRHAPLHPAPGTDTPAASVPWGGSFAESGIYNKHGSGWADPASSPGDGNSYRFTVDSLSVTGNTPDELEAAAIQQASELTGRPVDVLRVSEHYTIKEIPPEYLIIPGNFSEERLARIEAGRGKGHRLMSAISVGELRKRERADPS